MKTQECKRVTYKAVEKNNKNKKEINIHMSSRDITVGVKTTTGRDRQLISLLNSLSKYDFKKIIIADDDQNPSPKKMKIYEKIAKKVSLEIIHLPPDTGLAAGRNEIVQRLETKYLLLLDDDMEVQMPIDDLINVLESDRKIGAIAATLYEHGKILGLANNLKIVDKYLIKYTPAKIPIEIISGIPIIKADMIANAAVFRKKVFKDSLWDPTYKIGYEHVDFYLTHKKIGKWQFAITPSVVIQHNPGGSRQYRKIRRSKKRLSASRKHFLEKWKLKGIIDTSIPIIHTEIPLTKVLWKKTIQTLPPSIAYKIVSFKRFLIGE